LAAISDVAFDEFGNAWVVGSASSDVFRIPAAELRFPAVARQRATSAQPDLVIRSAALVNPGNLAFDASGALWVADRGSMGSGGGPAGAAGAGTSEGAIIRFEIPRGLGANANANAILELAPAARITSSKVGDLFQIGSIAFDGAQNLWLTSFVGLLRFDAPGALSGDVARAPDAVIEKSGYAHDRYFYSAAFDADGALWAASGDGLHYLTSVTKFTDPGLLQGRSSPGPAAMITGDADLLPAGGLAFDRAGNLWMATGESIVMYSNPRALRGVANPAPAVALKVAGRAAPTTNTHLVFLPAAGAFVDGAAGDEP
jgi:ligand-binding sensor domain-containing protein